MNTEVSRRGLFGGVAGIAGLLFLDACGSSSSGASGGSSAAPVATPTGLPKTSLTTLRTAWTYEDMPFDPATFYGGQGFSAMGSIYEGLVQYLEGGVEIGPQLATAWKISPDGKTYTFTLREGVTFHDGTPVNAAAIKASFERFIAIKGSPSYMLSSVDSMSAPNATTFVMKLKNVVNPMLDYLASYVGPKVTSPTLLAAHAGKDLGATYLVTHDAGTGPYTVVNAPKDQGYTLQAYPGYWGSKPIINTIQISIIPDITTQVLSLRKGDLDLVVAQVPANLIPSLQKDSSIEVIEFSSILKSMAWVKPTGYFASPQARAAVNAAINRTVLAKSAYGLGATASVSMYPASMAGGTQTTDPYTYNPSLLSDYVKSNPSPQLTIGYPTGGAADNLAAQLVQTELQAAGIKATVRGYGLEVYGFPTNPSKAPDILILSVNSDAASPATFIQEYLSTGGPLTLNGASVPAGDAALDAGKVSTSAAEATANYVAAAKAYGASNDFISLVDVKTVLFARSAVGQVTYTGANPFGPIFATTGGAT